MPDAIRGKERWDMVLKLPGGHKYFREKLTGRIGVADHSGRYPEDTDDGELFLDTESGKMLTVGDTRLWVPLVKLNGELTAMMEAAGDALVLSSMFGLPILDAHDRVWKVEEIRAPWK